MKKFSFKLDSVLKLRRHREQQALESLGRAQASHNLALRRFQVAESELQKAQLMPLGPEFGAQRETYIYRLRVRCAQLGEELSLCVGNLETCRLEAVEAQAERKAVERLRERRFSEWQLEAQREEDRNLSEVSNAARVVAGEH